MIFLIGLRHSSGAHDSRAPLKWRGPMKVFFQGGPGGGIRGLPARNPCAIGVQPVHTRVDSCGLPPKGDSTKSNFALVADIGYGFDFHLHARIDERLYLDQGRRRPVLAEVTLADRVDARPFGDVRHEDEHLDDLIGPPARMAQAGVDRLQGNLELADGVRRYGPVRLHADHAGEVYEAARPDDMAVVADRLHLPGHHESLDRHQAAPLLRDRREAITPTVGWNMLMDGLRPWRGTALSVQARTPDGAYPFRLIPGAASSGRQRSDPAIPARSGAGRASRQAGVRRFLVRRSV